MLRRRPLPDLKGAAISPNRGADRAAPVSADIPKPPGNLLVAIARLLARGAARDWLSHLPPNGHGEPKREEKQEAENSRPAAGREGAIG